MRNADAKTAVLKRVPFLRNCPDKQLAKLASKVEEAAVPAGRLLMQEGSFGHEAFIVVNGSAAVSAGGVTLATIGPGEFIGEMAMLSGEPRSATVTATSDMQLLVLGPTTFRDVAEHPDVARALTRGLARRLADIQAQL